MKVTRGKRILMYRGRNIRIMSDLSTEIWQARKSWQDIFRVLNEKNMQTRILYPPRLSFRVDGRDKDLPRLAETERICDHQADPARNIKEGSIKKEGPQE